MLLDLLLEMEAKACRSANRSIALITRACAKTHCPSTVLPLLKRTTQFYGVLIRALIEIDDNLVSTDLKASNPDIYSDLLMRKAELVARSPDARVRILLELMQFHVTQKYLSEAVSAQLTAAAVVAEYLLKLGRVPADLHDKVAAKSFAIACPSAGSEECPPEVADDLPNIRGFCTSQYFSEYGLIYLFSTAMETCKRAQLFELSGKIQMLLSPIAVFRRLWHVVQKHFAGGGFQWQIIEALATKSDRSFGNYYRIEFPDRRVFIYRETAFANLWQVSERLKKSAEFYANGRPVEIVNEGEKLTEAALSKDCEKYCVHVKAVAQNFSKSERKKRVTPFEQNHNVDEFYFDIPLSKSAQASIEHCWLRRTVFKLPHPIPYIVKRVEIPPQNIRQFEFSPIEYSCQNLELQIDRIEEAMVRKDFGALQPLIQGSLLTAVNEGPKKMAEVFLTGDEGSENEEHRIQLRALFRQFIRANSLAVVMHSDHAHQNPVFAVLQEELEIGLNRLSSTLQPYLN
jgi:hypothetical protein